MKLAIFSESPADELSVRLLIEAMLGRPTELIATKVQRPPGSTGVKVLPAVVNHLYYHTDADALVVVVDSDDTPVHQVEHDEEGAANPRCRMRAIRAVIKESLRRLHPVEGRRLRFAVGTPVPAIEAWCLSGTDAHVSEGAWVRYLQTKQRPAFDRRSLKRALYGTETPSRDLETRLMSEGMRRAAADLDALERRFPNGFGALFREIRGW